jgi:DNA-binding transcriptional MocR family regulator
MKLGIAIDRLLPEALHWQIAEAIRSQILDGELKPGQRLPPIRDLAKDLSVHRLTVFKAYEELSSAKLVESRPGSGTFVASEFSRKAATDMLGRMGSIGPMNRFEAVSEEAGIRSLASNVPDPWLFRADDFLLECYELRKASPWIFYYAPPAGAHELCRVLASHLTSQGLPTTDSQIVVTSGNTHSMTLALALLLPPGGTVAIEDPTFLSAKVWFEQRGYRYRPIARSAAGIDLKALKQAITDDGCRAVIVSPSFGQVTGLRLNDEERERLVQTCADLDCPIIELASTGLLSYDQDLSPPISSLCDPGASVYVDDFSSALSPGLRIGFLRLSQDQARQLEAKLQSEQYSGVQFIQIALANYIERGLFRAHLERVLPKYRARRDRMVASLRTHMPTGASWTHPQGGFSCWIEFPPGPDYGDLYLRALDKGVAIGQGRLFTDRLDANRFARLSFGTQDPPAIEEAVRILGDVLQGFASQATSA